MKFAFSLSTVIEANSEEDALNVVSSHISTVARHLANERKLSDCEPKFTLSPLDETTPHDDLRHDAAKAKFGPIPLNLDPESPEGIAHAEQLAQAAANAEAAAGASEMRAAQ